MTYSKLLSDKPTPGAAAKPPMSNASRVSAWKQRHNMKRKVAEIPRVLALAFEEKLKSNRKAYQAWVIEQIQQYLNRSE